jgi:hypothetical protein
MEKESLFRPNSAKKVVSKISSNTKDFANRFCFQCWPSFNNIGTLFSANNIFHKLGSVHFTKSVALNSKTLLAPTQRNYSWVTKAETQRSLEQHMMTTFLAMELKIKDAT